VPGAIAAFEALDLRAERVDVLEAAVDEAKRTYAHLIQVAHASMTSSPTAAAKAPRAPRSHGARGTIAIDRRLQLLVAHRALLERLAQPAPQLVLVEGLAPVVAL
jgi:hypothetical protein